MSIDSTRIHCTGCEYEYAEHYQPIILKCRIETGIVSCYQSNVWCYECNRITDAEDLPDVETIKEKYGHAGVSEPEMMVFNIRSVTCHTSCVTCYTYSVTTRTPCVAPCKNIMLMITIS
jgi:hypothetical protein